MPTYDYECAKCGNHFEKFQKMTDDPSAKCPKCGGKSVRLISHGSGIIFKGSGFYETDYKRKKSAKAKEEKPCSSPKGPACSNCPSNKKE